MRPWILLKQFIRSSLSRFKKIKVRDISDEYTLRLSQINTGMQDVGNLFCFDYAITNLPSDNPILEIGAFCGLSTNLIAYYKQRAKKKNLLITVDQWDYSSKGMTDKGIGDSNITGDAWGRFAKETFERNVRFFSADDLPCPIELSSDVFFERWAAGETVISLFKKRVALGGTFSFCYIDGNHSYENVARDFTNCDRFIDEGGFILFDDSATWSGSPGVIRLLREITQSKAYKRRYEVVMQNPNYLLRRI